jgi:hypothetical protein
MFIDVQNFAVPQSIESGFLKNYPTRKYFLLIDNVKTSCYQEVVYFLEHFYFLNQIF